MLKMIRSWWSSRWHSEPYRKVINLSSAAFGALVLLGTFQNCGEFKSPTLQNNTLSSVGFAAQVNDIRLAPGAPAVLAIKLNKSATKNVSFSYITLDDTARAGTHYVASKGTGSIQAGAISGVFQIPTITNYGSVFINKSFVVKIIFDDGLPPQTARVTFTANPNPYVRKDSWKTVAGSGNGSATASSARALGSAVWTGDKILLWGGQPDAHSDLGDGAIYDPVAQTWSALRAMGAPSPRNDQATVFTGTKMLVWGGYNNANQNTLGDGAAYDVLEDSWSPITASEAPIGRYDAGAVWTGSRMIIWGGATVVGNLDRVLGDGALYDPVGDKWTKMSAVGAPSARRKPVLYWTGSKLIVWGGVSDQGVPRVDGSLYDPVTDTWSPLSSAGAPAVRWPFTVWTGSKLIVWSGYVPGTAVLNTGAIYDLATNTWSPMSTVGAPSARCAGASVWTGTEMIVWGGISNDIARDGAAYRPDTNTWSPVSIASAPSAREEPFALWIGNGMFIYGGIYSDSVGDGGIYY